MRLELHGKACIITGAGRGIGRATARLLCNEGARVVLVGRGAENLERAATECRDIGPDAVVLALDVTSVGAAERVADVCLSSFGQIDVLVNNAGESSVRALGELSDEEWQAQWELNVLAPLRLTRAVAPVMAAGGGGAVVNVCSSSGRRPSSTNAAYSVSKAAQLALTKVLAEEYVDQGLRINAVAPGPTTSELWMDTGGLLDQVAAGRGGSRDDALQAAAERIPVKRFGTVEEVAAVIVLLCTGELAPSGAVWPVDGGHVSATIS